jgi:hypothetical protein
MAMPDSRIAVSTNRTTAAGDWLSWLCIAVLIAGTCDICFATGFSYFRSGVAPTRVLQFVASGILGPASFQGGTATAALGLAIHYLNAFIITGIFFAAAAWFPVLTRQPVLVGPPFGLVVYLVMNLVVIPLSRIGPRPIRPVVAVPEIFVHMFLIGLPIALCARRARAPSPEPRAPKRVV